MNNLRLLRALLCAELLSSAVCGVGQRVVTLDEIFMTAEAQSAQLRPALTAITVAERELDEAKSARLPDLKANLSVSYLGDGFTTKRNFSDYMKAPIPHLGNGLSLTAEQPVYTGGRVTNAIRLAETKVKASTLQSDLTRNNLRLELTSLYLDLYRYANLRKVVESNIAAAKKVLEEMRWRYEHGISLHNDITRYELLISDLDLQLISINNTLTILNNNLVTIAGMPENTVIAPDTTILQKALPSAQESWWQQEAEANSPSLNLAKAGVELSRHGEKLAKSQMLPQIGLRAGWTIDGPILVEVPPINRNLSYWYVGVGVNYNLSSLYKDNKTVAKSRMATRESEELLAATADNVAMTVKSDYIRYLEAYEELKTRDKGCELAESNYHVVSTRYGGGMALLTDMLDAANSRLDAERRLVDARINILFTYYKLLFTAGKI